MSGRTRLVAGWLAWLVVAHAEAGFAEEGDVRRFRWHPSLTLHGLADDNVFQRRRDPEGDVALWVQPALELGYRGRAYDLGAEVGADFRQYLDTRELDDQVFYRAKADVELGLWRGLTLRLSDVYTPQPQFLGLPEDQGSNLQQTNLASAELRFAHAFDSIREVIFALEGARFDTERFTLLNTGQGAQRRAGGRFRADYWQGGGSVELRRAFGRRSALYARGRVRARQFDEDPSADHTLYMGRLGFETRLLSRLELELAGGYGVIDFVRRSDVPRLLGSAQLRYRHRRGWNFEAGAHSRFTSDLQGGEFHDTTGRVGIEKEFGPRTTGEIEGFLTYLDAEGSRDFAGSPSTNFFGGVEVRVRRQLGTRLQLILGYRHWANRGAYTLDDFDQNRVTATLSYRY
ncbi:MAG: outer membrane beta-barrel protein [Myxococcota bacterium]